MDTSKAEVEFESCGGKPSCKHIKKDLQLRHNCFCNTQSCSLTQSSMGKIPELQSRPHHMGNITVDQTEMESRFLMHFAD